MSSYAAARICIGNRYSVDCACSAGNGGGGSRTGINGYINNTPSTDATGVHAQLTAGVAPPFGIHAAVERAILWPTAKGPNRTTSS